VAEIEANSSSGATIARTGRSRLRRAATRPIVVRIGAVALALLGVVALIVHPATHTRAEARFTVPIPLVVGDAVGAILTHGATPTAHGRRITVASSDANRAVARARAETLARVGLDGARQHLIMAETRRVDAARSDRAQAAAQLATLASRTGLSDPESAYRQRVAFLQNLREQRAAAAAAGEPLAAIDAQLAENQEAVFDLQLQVTRHAELIRAQTTAERSELDATGAIKTAERALGSASVQVSDHAPGVGFGTAPGVAALVIAGIVLLSSELRSRRAALRKAGADARREPELVGERDEMALAASEAAALESGGMRTSRYLEFYRALAPSPAGELDPAPAPVDLVHEEALEEGADVEQEPAGERDGSRP
jgi:hypothetical protein